MTMLFSEFLVPGMFLLLFTLFLLGCPVAFSLAICGFLAGCVGVFAGILGWSEFYSIPVNIWDRVISNQVLLAIPFFTLMGLVLERSGMAEALLDAVARLFGGMKAGLAYAVIFVGALMAATTGIVAASVMTLGLIALPIMLRNQYDRRISCGLIAASGSLAQIIPPSLVLIIIADQLGQSAGDLYMGAVYPSLLLVGAYIAYIISLSWLQPHLFPKALYDTQEEKQQYINLLKVLFLPLLAIGWLFFSLFSPLQALWPFYVVLGILDGQSWQVLQNTLAEKVFPTMSVDDIIMVIRQDLQLHGLQNRILYWLMHPLYAALLFALGLWVLSRGYFGMVGHYLGSEVSEQARKIVWAILPPLLLIFLVLGTIVRGIATPTEASAMGAIGSMIIALANRRLNRTMLRQALRQTAFLACFVMFLLLGARIFTQFFYALGGHDWVEALFSGLPEGQLSFLLFVNLMIFLLAFFLDFFELVFIIVPLLVPIAQALGIDLVFFGVMLAVNIQTSFLHPPFGFALFFLRGVAPQEDYRDTITGRIVAAIKTGDIYRGALPFLAIQLLVLSFMLYYPDLVKRSYNVTLDLSIINRYIPPPPQSPTEAYMSSLLQS